MKEKILVIGGTGFIGSHVLKNLSKKKFILFSLSKKKKTNLKKIKNVKYIFKDITKINLLKKINENFDHIINLCGYVDHSDKKKNDLFHFQGTKNAVRAFNSKNLKSFIQIGSSLEYGRLKSPQREKKKCKPIGIYGSSKYKASKFIENYSLKNNLPYIILRPYQVFGPNQKKNRLIPQTIDACFKNKNFDCTSGTQLRDFIYIDDFTDLIKKIIKNNKTRKEILNVGTGKPISVKLVINKIKSLIKKGNPKFGASEMRKDEIKKLYPSIKKVKKKFHWSPKVSLLKGLKKTILSYEKK